jgi:soluble lytic murein transglycosylase-like protein
VRAIITVESSWQSDAVSEKGAAGLMQLMPETAKHFGIRNRFDSAANIEGGVKCLAWLHGRFNGDRILATAAYFAGETRIAAQNRGALSPDVAAYTHWLLPDRNSRPAWPECSTQASRAPLVWPPS